MARIPERRTGRPLRRVALAVAIFLACVCCFAVAPASGVPQLLCAPTAQCSVSVSGGSSRGRTVDVVGDSITYLSSPEIRRSLSSYSYTIRATEGDTMDQMFPAIQELSADPARDWVVELGTNDAREIGGDWSASYAQEVAALQPEPCVLLVTVNPRIGARAALIDRDMDWTALTNHHVHLLDWGTLEWDSPRWVDPDGIHPTAKGSAELAKLIRLALRQDCR